ncbi:MAG: fimbrillin family protein [Prevotella sp.]|nr:fimbrillin family protein [Prevotella sp.]
MKKKSFYRLARLFPLPLLAASLLVASCSSDDSNSPAGEGSSPQRPIYIEVAENPMQSASASREGSRGAEMTTSGLKEFYMYHDADDYHVTKSGSVWTTVGSWPGTSEDNNTKYTFYAFAGTSKENYITASQYINFTVDELASEQKDLIVAQATASHNDHNGKVYFTFDHVCAALTFNIRVSAKAAEKRTVVVNKVELCNVPNNGKYYFSSDSWSGLGGETSSYTLTNSNITLTESAQDLPCGYLFLIPQTLTAWDKDTNTSGAYIDITLTINNDSETKTTARIPFGLTLEQGWVQPIDLNIGTAITDAKGAKIFK